jgi:hypothetical protein
VRGARKAGFEMAFSKFAIHIIEPARGISHQLFLTQMIERAQVRLQTRSESAERRAQWTSLAQKVAAIGAGCEVIVKRKQFSRLQTTLAVTSEKLC